MESVNLDRIWNVHSSKRNVGHDAVLGKVSQSQRIVRDLLCSVVCRNQWIILHLMGLQVNILSFVMDSSEERE